MKVAIVQQICSQQQQENLNHSIQGIREAASQGAKLILLPELHIARYFCQVEDTRYFALAEPIPGPSTAIFSALAVELKVVLVISLFERRTAGIYHNTAVVLDTDGRIAGRYRKMHIPDDPGFYEKFYFTPGDLGFTPINTSIGCLGVLVCWDQWYPEAARLMALAGAELLLYPSAIGWNPEDDAAEKYRQREAWITIQRAHAIANGLPLLSSNRVGIEANPNQHIPGIQFWGTSFIAGPQGELLTIGSTDEPIVLVTEIDLQRTEKYGKFGLIFEIAGLTPMESLANAILIKEK